MANKMITRTITTYTYTTGKLNLTTMTIEAVNQHTFPYRLGQRARRELEKRVGNNIVGETSGEALYGMTLEDFLKYAKPMTAEPAEEAPEKPAETESEQPASKRSRKTTDSEGQDNV